MTKLPTQTIAKKKMTPLNSYGKRQVDLSLRLIYLWVIVSVLMVLLPQPPVPKTIGSIDLGQRSHMNLHRHAINESIQPNIQIINKQYSFNFQQTIAIMNLPKVSNNNATPPRRQTTAEDRKKKEMERQQKEKEEELKKKQEAEAERLRRKEERAAAKKAEEEEKKKRREEEEAAKKKAEEEASKVNESTDTTSNNMDEKEEEPEEASSPTHSSPQRKKQRQSSSTAKPTNNKSTSTKRGRSGSRTPGNSTRRRSQSKDAKAKETASGKKTSTWTKKKDKNKVTVEPPYKHKHQRTLFATGVELDGMDEDENYKLYPQKCALLLEKLKNVDSTLVIEAVTKGDREHLSDPKKVSSDLTELAKYFHTTADSRNFNEQVHKKDRNGNELRVPEVKSPVVWFKFYVSHDWEPQELIEGMQLSWNSKKGRKIELDTFGEHKVTTPVIAVSAFNRINHAIIEDEMDVILEQARCHAEWNGLAVDHPGIDINKEPPAVKVVLKTPTISGQDTSAYQKWSYAKQQNRKVVHFQVLAGEEEYLVFLCKVAKNMGLFDKYWGEFILVTELPKPNLANSKKGRIGRHSKAGANKRLLTKVLKAINYQLSFTADTIEGIHDADKVVTYIDEKGDKLEATIRAIFYDTLKSPADGKQMFAQFHWVEGCTSAEVVVPNCVEVEHQITQLNKNASAFLYFILKDINVPEDFINKILKECMCPDNNHKIAECEWDSKTKTLTTKEDREDSKADEEVAKRSFYIDAFAVTNDKGKAKKDSQYANAAMMFDMTDDKTATKTIRSENDGLYAGDPGTPKIDLSKKFESKVDESVEEKDEAVELDEESSLSESDASDDSDVSQLSLGAMKKLAKLALKEKKRKKKMKKKKQQNMADEAMASDAESLHSQSPHRDDHSAEESRSSHSGDSISSGSSDESSKVETENGGPAG